MQGSFKAGYVAIIGKPNVGKSTLLNSLLKYKLSIVTPKPQTTRHRILGILNGENFQALFIDTPGMIKPAYPLQKIMQKEVKSALEDADLIVLMIEPKDLPDENEKKTIQGLLKKPTILVINKIDTVDKRQLLPIIEEYSKMGFKDIYPISALYNDGVDDLKKGIVENLPFGQPFYPQDQITERPERFFVAEIIREAIFNHYGEEIPYSTTVAIEEFKERGKAKDYIKAIIYTERDSQKAILIGKDGSALKKVGSIARKNIENFLGRPVFLELWVKVKEGWRHDETFIKDKIYRV
uniref:GTPase Era n=1 Tax=candidate division WOR-3 bacterium TaxID=2052148 RepID=A0A7C6EHK2_UNCW3